MSHVSTTMVGYKLQLYQDSFLTSPLTGIGQVHSVPTYLQHLLSLVLRDLATKQGRYSNQIKLINSIKILSGPQHEKTIPVFMFSL